MISLRAFYDLGRAFNDLDRAFCDLSRAFDFVHHNNLLTKLTDYGVRRIPLQWIFKLLTNINQ